MLICRLNPNNPYINFVYYIANRYIKQQHKDTLTYSNGQRHFRKYQESLNRVEFFW